MHIHLTDQQIKALLGIDDFLKSCDEAFRLYGSGDLVNHPRKESLEQSEGMDVFRLELCGSWAGVLDGRKIIIERSDVGTGRLGDRTATIELALKDGQTIHLDAETITNQRTGCAAALGARYLGPGCQIAGIVGTGRIAESAALAVDCALSPQTIRVTSRSSEKREMFAERIGPSLSAGLEMVATVEEVASDADVVIAAVPTPAPILTNDMLKENAHLSVVAGDPRTVQLDKDILLNRTVVVDHFDQARASGDFLLYSEIIQKMQFAEVEGEPATIGDAALGRLEALRASGCLTYFTGMAIQDLHAGYTAVSRKSEAL
jgi:ornithine cyclodeaminase/alanine dehydrogenase-like protein (mu-crystallin family)